VALEAPLELLRATVVGLLGDVVKIEIASSETSSLLVGLYLDPLEETHGEPIEVWNTGVDWVLTVGAELRQELHGEPESSARVNDVVLATALGGCAIYARGIKRYFVMGDHESTMNEMAGSLDRRMPKLLRSWPKWRESPLRESQLPVPWVGPRPDLAVRIR
jgi:hypothetical protein